MSKKEYVMLNVKLVHIHIGKTGGTSLARTLSHALGEGICTPPFIQSHITRSEAEAYSQYAIVNGHISRRDQMRWFDDRHIITILREPIDRALSFIHYVRSLDPVYAGDVAHMPIRDFIETAGAQINLNNTMVRQLGGHMLEEVYDIDLVFEEAKRTLRAAAWVGRQNFLDTDVKSLEPIIGASLKMRVENLTPKRPRIQDEDPDVVARLVEISRYDDELWRWAQKDLF